MFGERGAQERVGFPLWWVKYLTAKPDSDDSMWWERTLSATLGWPLTMAPVADRPLLPEKKQQITRRTLVVLSDITISMSLKEREIFRSATASLIFDEAWLPSCSVQRCWKTYWDKGREESFLDFVCLIPPAWFSQSLSQSLHLLLDSEEARTTARLDGDKMGMFSMQLMFVLYQWSRRKLLPVSNSSFFARFYTQTQLADWAGQLVMGSLRGEHLCANIAVGDEMWGLIYSQFLPCFPPCQPATLTVCFPTLRLALPHTLSYYARALYLIPLATMERSAQAISEAIIIRNNVNICPGAIILGPRANWINIRVLR